MELRSTSVSCYQGIARLKKQCAGIVFMQSLKFYNFINLMNTYSQSGRTFTVAYSDIQVVAEYFSHIKVYIEIV